MIEARTEAESILNATVKTLANSRAPEISKEERAAITETSARLRVALVGADYKLIRNRIDELNQATTHLAEMLMNGALQTALEGKRLDEV